MAILQIISILIVHVAASYLGIKLAIWLDERKIERKRKENGK